MSALLDLRATLSALLSAELGTYTLSNGSSCPAVRCSGPDETRYPGTVVEGLEMVIIKDPDLVPVRQYENERVLAEWTVFLVAWGDVPSGVAAQKIVDAIPGCEVERVTVPDGIGPQDQYRLTIRSPASALALDALSPALATYLVTLAGDRLTTLSGDYLLRL